MNYALLLYHFIVDLVQFNSAIKQLNSFFSAEQTVLLYRSIDLTFAISRPYSVKLYCDMEVMKHYQVKLLFVKRLKIPTLCYCPCLQTPLLKKDQCFLLKVDMATVGYTKLATPRTRHALRTRCPLPVRMRSITIPAEAEQ